MRNTPKTTGAQARPRNHPHIPSPNALGAVGIYAGTVLTGTFVEHGKIYFDFFGDETSIGTFSTRAVPTRRA
jgi:hypothetical protein